jgi:hypothetical protein
MNYQSIITIEPGKRGGRPTIRGMGVAKRDGVTTPSLNRSLKATAKLIPPLRVAA